MRALASILAAVAFEGVCCAATWRVAESSNVVELTVSTGDLRAMEQGTGVVVRAEAAAAMVDVGEPDVPVLVYVLKARPGATARIAGVEVSDVREQDAEVLSRPLETVETVSDGVVRPVTLWKPEATIYGTDAYWPSPQARFSEAAMGTNAYLRVAVYPAQYNPVRRKLRIAAELTVWVTFGGVDEEPLP
jgi:hypothetical protein